MKKIDPQELQLQPFQLLDQTWALLVAGVERPNPMTVSWGGFGTLWNKPMVTVYVRPTRHTFHLLNQHSEFSLNFLAEQYRGALNPVAAAAAGHGQMGKKQLHPLASETIAVRGCRGVSLFRMPGPGLAGFRSLPFSAKDH
jgi:flavin reductase (DIM6/NTAB) family NADH-FMN oxidoreductase RutF